MRSRLADDAVIFIDGPSLFSSAKHIGFDIDYKRLLEYFSKEFSILRAFYYSAVYENGEFVPMRPVLDWLCYNGYSVVTKTMKEYVDSSGRRKLKGSMAVEMSVDAMEMSDHINHAIFFSGDGDYRRLVEAIQRRGVRVSVVSTMRVSPPVLADELRRQADVFIELESLMNEIGRGQSPRSSTLRP